MVGMIFQGAFCAWVKMTHQNDTVESSGNNQFAKIQVFPDDGFHL